MRDSVLWRKISRIVMLIAERHKISDEQALNEFYSSKTYEMLKDAKYGLQLMSDLYILDEFEAEKSC